MVWTSGSRTFCPASSTALTLPVPTPHTHTRAQHTHLASEESDLTLCVCGGAEYEYFKLDEKLFPEGSNPIQVITTRSNFSSPQIGAHPSGPMWP